MYLIYKIIIIMKLYESTIKLDSIIILFKFKICKLFIFTIQYYN